jgi:hypothetical protein
VRSKKDLTGPTLLEMYEYGVTQACGLLPGSPSELKNRLAEEWSNYNSELLYQRQYIPRIRPLLH